MGYKFQFITLAGWHALNSSMFRLSRAYKAEGMYAYSQLQEQEFSDEQFGFRAAKHQSFVGAGYFDAVQNIAGAITPMPGGTGPMTVACLLENTLYAATLQNVI